MMKETVLNQCPICQSAKIIIVPEGAEGLKAVCTHCKAHTETVPITEGLRAASVEAQTKWNNNEVIKYEG